MEQQQPRNSDCKCCRTGYRRLSRNMQYNLHCHRWLRRYSICLAGSDNKPDASITSVTGTSPVMPWRNSRLYSQWSGPRRRHWRLEQQQSGSSDSERCRTGNGNIRRHMQYYLHYNRRLRRHSISTEGCYNKSECQYNFSDRADTTMYRQVLLPTLLMEL